MARSKKSKSKADKTDSVEIVAGEPVKSVGLALDAAREAFGAFIEDEIVETDVEAGAAVESESALGLDLEEVEEVAVAEADSESELEASSEMGLEDEIEGSELAEFDSVEIEDIEFIEVERLDSIVESLLFASDKPVSLATIKISFKGTNIKTEDIRKSLNRLAVDLAGGRRGVTLEEINGGYQVRTKLDNTKFLTRSIKPRTFKLSGPALEVLAIAAYKQPIVKSEIDEIRGVESGHLLRALMEKGLIGFEGKSELPGKPMQYGTSRKFLEIFGLRNLKELPTLSQIDELLPDGIGDEDPDKEKLGDLTDKLSQATATVYSEGEDELLKITEQLQEITTTTAFFENEKAQEKESKNQEKARLIREALSDPDRSASVSNRDKKWLERFDLAALEGSSISTLTSESVDSASAQSSDSNELSQDETEVESNMTEQEEGRFSEEMDRSEDQDLNVALHDPEETI